MKRAALPGIGLIAMLLLLLAAAPRAASAASNGVRDEAHLFSPDAISRAEQAIRQINQKHHKDVLVETFPEIPQDEQSRFQQDGRDRFYAAWADQLAHQNAVDGVMILITRTPGHIQVWDGNKTGQRLFTSADRDRLSKNILAGAFRNKQYDQGLEQGVQFIQQQMDAHVPARGGTAGSAAPAAPPPPSNYPQTNYPTPSRSTGSHWGLGGIACVVIGIIILIMLIRAVVGRSIGNRPGGYYPPPGGQGYPPGGPGYPPAAGGYGPGYGGGGGGGFGRGLLGGLLGGALGGYAGEKWAQRGQQQGGYAPPPQQGGDYSGGGADYSSGVDTSGTSSGADFDSGGGGGGGADFGGGGGADSSSGADFGGGGGDIGGGGSDFGGGGGGDSGSSGADF